MKRTVFITGVSKGIGRGIAERFLAEGYVLYGTFFRDENLARELETNFGKDNVHLIGPYDFTNIDDIKKCLETIKSVCFDSVIISAGIFEDGDDFNDFDFERFNRTMNCNFNQSLILCTGLKDSIIEGGSIVLMSSNDAYPGAFASMSYTISKAAVLSLMKCLCMNFGNKNIRVNSVAPGAIDTDMNTPEQAEIAPYFTPSNRMGTPVDVAKVVYFLASDEAAFVNGENITIDGGYSNMSILLKAEACPALSVNLREFIPTQKKS